MKSNHCLTVVKQLESVCNITISTYPKIAVEENMESFGSKDQRVECFWFVGHFRRWPEVVSGSTFPATQDIPLAQLDLRERSF
jgi:hypothetical protein